MVQGSAIVVVAAAEGSVGRDDGLDKGDGDPMMGEVQMDLFRPELVAVPGLKGVGVVDGEDESLNGEIGTDSTDGSMESSESQAEATDALDPNPMERFGQLVADCEAVKPGVTSSLTGNYTFNSGAAAISAVVYLSGLPALAALHELNWRIELTNVN